MGNRNPFRMSIDSETGWLDWGEVGPDAENDEIDRRPQGHDEISQARAAGWLALLRRRQFSVIVDTENFMPIKDWRFPSR